MHQTSATLPYKRYVKLVWSGVPSFLLISLCFFVVACGKMPVKVEAPLNVDSSAYYQSYPDISTDPSSEPATKVEANYD